MSGGMRKSYETALTTVGVTGVHIASAPKSGAVILKELFSHHDIRCLALVDYPQTCALGWDAPNLVGVCHVPQGIMGTGPFVSRLLEIHRETFLHIVIPCDDEDVAALASGASELADYGIDTLLPMPNSVEAVKKANFQKTLEKIGIHVPRQQTIWNLEELNEISIGLPLIVKGRLIHAYLARSYTEVRAFAAKLFDVWGEPVVLQEYIRGAEFSVTAVADRNSSLVGACAIRKVGISEQGKTWMAVTVSPDAFIPFIEGLLKELHWIGPLEMEFIVNADDSSPVAIEINPRFPAWVPVARYAGADLVKLVVEICKGEANSTLIAEPGMCFARTYHTGIFAMERLAKLHTHQKYIVEHRGDRKNNDLGRKK